MFKKVYSLYSAFQPSLRFTLSLQSAFYTQSAFYPWSAVCSPQSAFYTDRIKKRQSAGRSVAGTYESCYAFLPLERCGILIFFDGQLRAVWMDFRLEGTRRNVNLSTFLLPIWRAEQCDFWGGNRSSTGALSKHGFHPCPSIIKNSQRRIQTPSKSLKNRF